MQRRALLGASLAPLLCACGASASDDNVWEFRYRLKVIAYTARAEIENESILTARYRYFPSVKGEPSSFVSRAWGQAIKLDFGNRGALFAILDDLPNFRTSHAFHPLGLRTLTSLVRGKNYDNVDFRAGRVYDNLSADLRGEDHSVDRDSWPLFVRFADVRDASSAQLIHLPNQTYQFSSSIKAAPLDEALGDDVRIAMVTLGLVGPGLQPRRDLRRLLPCANDLGPREDEAENAQRPLHHMLRRRNFQFTGQIR
jgi:hypothetical protein